MFRFEHTFADELEGLYEPSRGAVAPAPSVIRVNEGLARELGLDPKALGTPEAAAVFAGSEAPEGSRPLAQAYAGHQFGGFTPQLGDGRALLLGELIDTQGERRDLQLKGSGPTPFSRRGDGKATIGPILREYLVGEFMHSAGIPTTRSLAAVSTGEMVLREGPLPGAVLARVASSHLRVGTFQFFAVRGEAEKLKRLLDYTIQRHYPECASAAEPALELLRAVARRQAALVAKWMAVGFVHGVMNTDNTTLSGETIDYGPCAFMEAYDPKTVFSSIDHGGRYAYGNQPPVMQWNLARFAETLLGLMGSMEEDQAVEAATEVLEAFPKLYEKERLAAFRAKLGLRRAEPVDGELIDDLLSVLEAGSADFTLAFRELADALRGDPAPIRARVGASTAFDKWLGRWRERVARDAGDPQERADAMDRVNPLYVPRNHKLEEALQAASRGDTALFDALLDVLADPFTRVDGREAYTEPAPTGCGPYTTFCGT